MNIALCANQIDLEMLESQLNQCCMSEGNLEIHKFHNESLLLEKIKSNQYDLVFVGLDGAIGMETVMKVREYSETQPMIWCSEDDGFGVIAYTLGVVAFLKKGRDLTQIENLELLVEQWNLINS